jgi:dTDP-4-dehydrorhamnose reductase
MWYDLDFSEMESTGTPFAAGRKKEGPRILLLGARGLLGKECEEVLGSWGNLWSLSKDELDITLFDKVEKTLVEFSPHFVVNCAAYTDVDGCEREVEKAFLVNAKAVGNLAMHASKVGARLVHISTDYVFDGEKPLPSGYNEDDPPCPKNIYGKSKLEGERLVLRVDANHLIVRTAWLYGRRGKSFPKAILKKLLEGQTVRVVCDQFGSPTWSKSVAFQIKALMEAGAKGIVHVTSMGYCSWYEFARTIAELLGLRGDIRPCESWAYPRPAPRPKNSILEKRRLLELGINRMRHWKEDLRIFLEAHGKEMISELGGEA